MDLTANSLPELREQLHDVRSRNKVTTKLDAPFTLFAVGGQASMLPVDSSDKGDDSRASKLPL